MNPTYILEVMAEMADNNNRYIQYLEKHIASLTRQKIALEEKFNELLHEKAKGVTAKQILEKTEEELKATIETKPKRKYERSGKFKKMLKYLGIVLILIIVSVLCLLILWKWAGLCQKYEWLFPLTPFAILILTFAYLIYSWL